ncbi:DUF1772 domain-containing protein [Bradyrhizobium sp.]|uniref:DUF1772 domain-containing protein n=1 Tax=Bradyrhizobium sp. TaxID=376 RepID=UPI003C386257
MVFGLLALIASAMFTGAAFYVNFAEQPARLTLDDRALLSEWKPSYKRGTAMQAPLALIGFVLGMLEWSRVEHIGCLIGAILIIAPWPWTLIVIRPTNNALLATDPGKAGPPSRALIVKWGVIHAVRTVLGGLATAAFFWACVSY